MIAEDFISGLTSRYRDKNDQERNKAFFEDLMTFTNKCPENHLKDVYDWIRVNHKYSTPFLLYKIYNYAVEQGYIEKKSQRKKVVSWLTCVKCGTHYSMVGRGCPNQRCKEKKATTSHGEYYPENMVEVTEDCYYCTIYPEIKKNKKWITFEGCPDFGKVQRQAEICGICQCKDCCKQMMMYHADPKGTTEKYKSGELGLPWIIEVDSLKETSELMNKDIERRKNI